MDAVIEQILQDSIAVKEKAIGGQRALIGDAAARLADCVAAGHKVLLFGNGGSAADCQHIAAEFVNRFRIERPPLGAIALTTDTSALTSIGNDYDFDEIFAKQITALGRSGDFAWGISTSGNSANVLRGVAAAKEIGLFTLGMTGSGGKLADVADLVFRVDSASTARVQETHITIAHILCELVDRILFPQSFDE